ncbi:MAG: hypothetical protein FRX49_05643 [Trebouxia sp. A1-2]|nr:MAG: hypothetical protein FRX49_05643 [Trebouxia sp. A1-2]
MSDAGKQTFAEKVAQNTGGDTGVDPSPAHSQSPAGVSGTMGGGGSALGGATVGGYGDGGADVAGTGAGDTGNQSGDTAGRQIEGASNQGLSGQGGVF